MSVVETKNQGQSSHRAAAAGHEQFSSSPSDPLGFIGILGPIYHHLDKACSCAQHHLVNTGSLRLSPDWKASR